MAYKDPERQRLYQRDYGRSRARVCQTRCQTPFQTQTRLLPAESRLKTAQDVLGLIAEQVAAVRDDPGVSTVDRARTIGFLAGAALRAIDAADLSARVEALELALKARREEPACDRS